MPRPSIRRFGLAPFALLLLLAPIAFADPGPSTRDAADEPSLEDARRAADAEVAATRQRVEAMQRLSQEHAQATADATHAFQERMKGAKTLEERRAIQTEFQAAQRAREEELKRKLTELRQP